MASLTVRVYDVRFGDAVLITISEPVAGHTVRRNILIDFGNAAAAGVAAGGAQVVDAGAAAAAGGGADAGAGAGGAGSGADSVGGGVGSAGVGSVI